MPFPEAGHLHVMRIHFARHQVVDFISHCNYYIFNVSTRMPSVAIQPSSFNALKDNVVVLTGAW